MYSQVQIGSNRFAQYLKQMEYSFRNRDYRSIIHKSNIAKNGSAIINIYIIYRVGVIFVHAPTLGIAIRIPRLFHLYLFARTFSFN